MRSPVMSRRDSCADPVSFGSWSQRYHATRCPSGAILSSRSMWDNIDPRPTRTRAVWRPSHAGLLQRAKSPFGAGLRQRCRRPWSLWGEPGTPLALLRGMRRFDLFGPPPFNPDETWGDDQSTDDWRGDDPLDDLPRGNAGPERRMFEQIAAEGSDKAPAGEGMLE